MKKLLSYHAEFKKKFPGAIPIYRGDDWYFFIGDDAMTAAKVLGITVSCNSDNIQTAYFPRHALDIYLPKLIKAGLRVCIQDEGIQ